MALVPSTSVGGASSSTALTQIFDSVASGAVASFDITGIAGTFTHLQLFLQARSDQGVAQVVSMRMNNDSGANYYSQSQTASAAAAGASESLGATSARIGVAPSTAATAGSANGILVAVMNYAGATFNKNWTLFGGRQDTTSSGNTVEEGAYGMWNNTAAITRITILPAAGNFIAGSRCTLYGLT